MAKIYKYFSHDVMDLVFQRDKYCGVKCSLPKDYNDPYELFLGMDLNTPADHLAFYNDIVQDIPQNPTTCFSKSPIVSPMWAHYANNHSGFVLEFDLEGLQEYFQGNPIWDVSYRSKPHENLKRILERAAVLKKPRYAYQLQELVFVESYFSKYDEWSYEKECRFVDMTGVTEEINGNKILFIPSEFVTSIILGSKFPAEKNDLNIEISEKNALEWYELVIGKSYPKPYMQNQHGETFIFVDESITETTNLCERCSEPLSGRHHFCSWCSITEAHEKEAASNNPFRMLASLGLLKKYMDSKGNVH